MTLRQHGRSAMAPVQLNGVGTRSLFLTGGRVLGIPDAVFGRWVRQLCRATNGMVAALCLCDDERRRVLVGEMRDRSVRPTVELAPAESLRDHLLRALPLNVQPTATAGYAEVPVTLGGQEVGQLAVATAGPFPRQVDLDGALRDAAETVSAHLVSRLAESELERGRQLVSSLHRIHEMIARAAPLRDILVAICETIESGDPTVMPSVLLLDAASSTLHSGVGPSLPDWYLAATDGLVIGPTIGTCGPAAWFGELTVSRDLSQDPNWASIQEMTRDAGIAHCWSMPVKGADGDVLGTLALYGRQPREPMPEHLSLLREWGRVAGIAIERSRSLDRLTYDARHDSLTGLPNRGAIFEQLEEAVQRIGSRPAAVLFIDLDGLKALNDTLGHDRADEMIRHIGLRLSAAMGEKNFVGRFGGDEFVVVIEEVSGPEQAADLGADLLAAVARPLPGAGQLAVTASIGIALIRTDTVEAQEAVRRSDAAMYEAKRSGGDRCVVADEERIVRVGRRLQMTRLLRGVETRGELALVFQPVVDLATMTVVAAEALLRWRNPTLGDVPPAEFVPVAEDTGSIVPIGAWVLRESCEAIARLDGQGHRLELDVNVSARQISHPDFPVWVRKTLSHAQFPADRLCLEITETALMPADALTDHSLRELDALGVQLVLDDFGTGYSSLSWLKQHPFGAIKIDHSFIHGLPDDPGDRAIVGGVLAMAQALSCTVTAEGVETVGQLDMLRTLGCERVQGFLLAEPMPVEELGALLAGRRP
jgi:diguanylate cyclase (GGDEF)-like protein